MVSYEDLGGLGPREGRRVSHVWLPPPPPPPWYVQAANAGTNMVVGLLFILPLFLLGRNRCSAAWLIWLPLGLSLGAVILASSAAWEGDEDVQHALCSLVAGLGATWLLTPHLSSSRPLFVFVKTVAVLAGFSVLAFTPRLLGESSGFFDFRSGCVLALGLASLAVAVALVLGGLAVRRRFGRARLVLWIGLWLWLIYNLGFGPAITLITGDHLEWVPYLLSMLVASAFTLGLLLPLLLLSFFQPFYRDRLLAYLNIPTGRPAPQAEFGPAAGQVA